MRDAKPGLAHLRPPAGTIVDDNRVCQGQTSLLIRKGVNVRNYLAHFGRAIWRCARPVTTLLRAYTAVGDRPRTPDEPDKSIKVSHLPVTKRHETGATTAPCSAPSMPWRPRCSARARGRPRGTDARSSRCCPGTSDRRPRRRADRVAGPVSAARRPSLPGATRDHSLAQISIEPSWSAGVKYWNEGRRSSIGLPMPQ